MKVNSLVGVVVVVLGIVFLDLSTLTLKNDLYFKAIERVIKEKSNYLFGLKIVDTYKGKDIPANSQAFTLRIFYQSQSKTLTASEVDGFHNAIREALSRTDGVRLR